jgi:hypothetical protein
MTLFSISLLVEDPLGQVVLRRILREHRSDIVVGTCYGNRGYGYIKKRAGGFNRAAKGAPLLMLADLEMECAPAQIRALLSGPRHPNLVFRVAIMEIESWILADRGGFSSFLGVAKRFIPQEVDVIVDPKKLVVNLARRCRRRSLREALVPTPGSTAKVGPGYNGQLSSFVDSAWNISEASQNSPSLRRAVDAILHFQPIWE